MNRRAVPELMGAAEVADHLGIKRQNVNRQAGLPAPVQQLRATRVWIADEIRAYALERDRRRDIRNQPTETEGNA